MERSRSYRTVSTPVLYMVKLYAFVRIFYE